VSAATFTAVRSQNPRSCVSLTAAPSAELGAVVAPTGREPAA